MTDELNLMRAEFEAWAQAEGTPTGRYTDGEYVTPTCYHWKAWQAAWNRRAKPAEASAQAEDYLRGKYGAYRGHPEWRALEEAFNAGRASVGAQAEELPPLPAPKLCDFGNQDDFDDAHDEWERQQRYAVVGAMEYNGNTVSYMYSKAKNYGNVLVECCNLIGGSGHIKDRIKGLMQERDEARAAIAADRASRAAEAQAEGLTDDVIERFALEHIAPGWKQLVAVTEQDSDYKQSEQFRRVKAYTQAIAAHTRKQEAQGDHCNGGFHNIADVRNAIVKEGYMCIDCGKLFSAADHSAPKEAQGEQAGEDMRTLLEAALTAELHADDLDLGRRLRAMRAAIAASKSAEGGAA